MPRCYKQVKLSGGVCEELVCESWVRELQFSRELLLLAEARGQFGTQRKRNVKAVPYLRPLVANFPPRRPGFEPRSGHVGFVVDKVALGQVFSEYFGFPFQFSFHRLLHIHHLSFGAGTIGQLVADVPSGLSLTQPQEKGNVRRRKPLPSNG
jgi:hypothetical protein